MTDSKEDRDLTAMWSKLDAEAVDASKLAKSREAASEQVVNCLYLGDMRAIGEGAPDVQGHKP